MNIEASKEFAVKQSASLVPRKVAVHRNAPSDARLLISLSAIARQRLATLQRFLNLQGTHSAAKAAGLVGSSVVTLWRWRNAYAAHGLGGLKPKAASGGKPSEFSKVRLPGAASREIERLTGTTGNARAAWRQFAASQLCPPLVARYVIQHGKAPGRLSGVGRVMQLKADCYLSADGRRLLIRAASLGVLVVPIRAKAAQGKGNDL